MQAVILAAGKGTRMGELTKDTPKPLLKLENESKTLLERSIESLPEHILRVVVVGEYQGKKVESFVKDLTPEHFKQINFRIIDVEYVNQGNYNGTLYALRAAKDLLDQDKDSFLVLMGDDLYSQSDLKALAKKPLGVLVRELEKDEVEENHAIVKLDDQGQLIDIVEKQPGKKGDLVNTGAYVLNDEIFKYPPALAGNQTSEYGLPQTFLQMLKDGHKFSVVKATYWKKVSTPEDLKA